MRAPHGLWRGFELAADEGHAYRQLGNAVAVPLVGALAAALAAALEAPADGEPRDTPAAPFSAQPEALAVAIELALRASPPASWAADAGCWLPPALAAAIGLDTEAADGGAPCGAPAAPAAAGGAYHDALGPRWRRWPLAVVARRARRGGRRRRRAAAAAPSAHAQTLPTPTRAHKNYVATALSAAQRHATLLRAARCGQVAMAADGAGAEAAEGVNVDGARRALREADAVCFDVDSTVVVDEGIDVLADYLGCGAEVAALTRSAMGGSMPFHEALAARLDVMRPSRQQVEAMLEASPIEGRLTPGVAPLIAALQARGTRVFLVSGGFRQMIEPVAAAVGVAADDIFANRLLFDADGAFASHDSPSPRVARAARRASSPNCGRCTASAPS